MIIVMVNIVMLSNDDTLNQRLDKAFKEYVSNLISFKITTIDEVYQDIQSAELLLVDPQFKGLDLKKLPKDCAYAWFVEEQNSNVDNMFYVYLYQSIFEICQSLIKVIENYRNQLVCKSDFFQNTKVISFISCGGRTGATTIAEGFTINKINKKQSILYIMLSPLGKVNFLKQNITNIEYLDDISITKRYYKENTIINGFENIENSMNFKSSILEEIISKSKKQEYDFIIIDTNINYINVIPDVFKLCNQVILVMDNTDNSINYLDSICKFASNINPIYDDKIKVIHNKCEGGYNCMNSRYNQKLAFKINELPKDFTIGDLSRVTSTINF